MNKDLNLVEILKNTPKGTKLYSTIFGEVIFERVDLFYPKVHYPIIFTASDHTCNSVTKEGKYYYDYNGECTLFPSKNQRDWSKFKLDLPIDTPVMVSYGSDSWKLRYYAGNNKTFCNSNKSPDDISSMIWNYIIPFDKFNPNNIEESLKYNIVDN